MNKKTLEETKTIYEKPLLQLISEAHGVHLQYHDPSEIQTCQLISIKTGGCPEDCKYCAQSSRYQTSVAAQPLMKVEEALKIAKEAKNRGATRVCLGAAWREVRDSQQFEQVLSMVAQIAELGLEVCCTLGMLKEHQAKRLKEAGLYAYNHNLDTSESYYKQIITTRTYSDRLKTIGIVQEAGISVCCGGILGLGETRADRVEFLLRLSQLDPQPDSVPINRLARVPGTPLQEQPELTIWEMLRAIATARILMPRAMVRLSCGREEMNMEQQALCFFAGANSIFIGDRLLTVGNTPLDKDEKMFTLFGLHAKPPG